MEYSEASSGVVMAGYTSTMDSNCPTGCTCSNHSILDDGCASTSNIIMIPVFIDMAPEAPEPRYWRPHEIEDLAVERRRIWRTPRRGTDRLMGDKKFYTLGGTYRPAVW